MKTNQIAAVLIALVTLQSCKKKDTIVDEKPPMKLLTRVIFAIENRAIYEYYTYDDKHRLKSANVSELTTYTYSNGDLATIEGPRFKFDFTYKSGKIIQAIGKENGRNLVYGYVYVGNDLSQIHINENGVVVEKWTYTIVNHNITKIVQESGEGIFITDFTYGSHKNKFFHAGLSQIIGIETIDRYSVNDLLETKRTAPDGSFVKTTDSYVYDEEGLPVTSTSTVVL
ncbi:MAG TPA: hypothetical protein VF679_05975, partial [Pedobacter sp.]